MTHHRVFVALDGMSMEAMVNLAFQLKGRVGYKLNDALDEGDSAKLIFQLRMMGAGEIWADAKLHDIPNTVANRVRRLSAAGASYITVMASGEIDMMRAAIQSRSEYFIAWKPSLRLGTYPPPAIGDGIIAVTVLTSLDDVQASLMFGRPSLAGTLYLARLAKLAGVSIVVCSPHEVGYLAKRPELSGISFFTPGIRPAGAATHDQQRVDTPAAAIKAGATSLVIGRPITGAPDPLAALDAIEREIEEAAGTK